MHKGHVIMGIRFKKTDSFTQTQWSNTVNEMDWLIGSKACKMIFNGFSSPIDKDLICYWLFCIAEPVITGLASDIRSLVKRSVNAEVRCVEWHRADELTRLINN